jgi:glycosyltransferase involved in cell wall biosynthesis
MKIYTATPMAVLDETDQDSNFFSRDMGLTCHGLQAAGVESKVVLLDFPGAKQHPDMIRATLVQMEDAQFWRSLELDAVVLGAWAAPKYTSIARAIKGGGAKLIIRCDSGAAYDAWQKSLKENMYRCYLSRRYKGAGFISSCLFSASVAGLFYVPAFYTKKVVEHMSCADLIMNETPEGVRYLKALLCRYGLTGIAARVKCVLHPVAAVGGYDERVTKEQRIIAVGRWDNYQKNTPMLIESLAKVLEKYPDCEAHIFGSGGDVLDRLCRRLPEAVRSRIHIGGQILNSDLETEYQKSRILFMPSRTEGSSVAAEEALCFGCSVVGSSHIFCMRNFVSKNSGTLARKYSVDGMVEALSCEINAWELGLRNAGQIAAGWGQEVCLDAVVRNIMSAVD